MPLLQDTNGSTSPNTKFIIEKFNMLEGEKYVESFACALA